jgi:hypothetical protein
MDLYISKLKELKWSINNPLGVLLILTKKLIDKENKNSTYVDDIDNVI